MSGYFWQLVGISSAIKVLLLPAYYSTDFEVHRNWLAITHSLPLNRWYLDVTSEWTLDYPPFFAYFEWLLSQLAKYVDAKMLIVHNLNYASESTVYFQRASVIVTDLIYMLGATRCMAALGVLKSTQQHIAGCMLLFLNVGLIFVDHIHFQYNGFLFGILLLGISALLQQRYLWSAFTFAVLLNFKHIFLYMAPAFAVYLLRFYCLDGGHFVLRMLKLLAAGLAPFVLSFGPFWQQLPQLIARLFPFKRGLTHAYWAPNFWALYNAADKVATSVLRRRPTDPAAGGSTSSGLVQEVQHVVLPTITPKITFALTLLAMLPILWKLYRTPSRERAQLVFMRAVVLCACSAFMFGWHVHEKAILMCLIPLCLLTLLNRQDARYAYILGVSGYFSLFPLLFELDLLVPRYSLFMAYMAMMYGQLERMYKSKPYFHPLEWLYFLGFLAIPVYEHLISPLMGFNVTLPFMPLLLTSVYSALGVHYFYVRYYIYALDMTWSWSWSWSRRVTQIKSSAAKRKRKTK